MNETTTSGDAATGPAGARNFGQRERKRQAAFRKGLTTPTDPIGLRHDYLLALGREEENLFPTLRGGNGALRFFADRGIKWWNARRSGDVSDGKRPTRNMASSQLACVNFLLPLIDIPGTLTAVLKAIDDDVTGVVAIEHEETSSPVELEWIGLNHALEGPSVKSRGANSTSVDAFMVAEIPSGRRAYAHPQAVWYLPLDPWTLFCAVQRGARLLDVPPHRIARKLNVVSAEQAERFVFCVDDAHERWLGKYLSEIERASRRAEEED